MWTNVTGVSITLVLIFIKQTSEDRDADSMNATVANGHNLFRRA